MRILLVDDEPALRQSIARSLRFEGYTVVTAPDGRAAIEAIESARPDAVVLDVMMPRLDGLGVCRWLRASGDRTPVLILTARDAVQDTVAGLDAGADDYLAKPFAYDELLARLRALLRRTAGAPGELVLEVGPVRLDPGAWQVTVDGAPVELTRTEFSLLETLMRHRGQVLTRSQLYSSVWGEDLDGMSNTLDVYVGYLRRKLEAAGSPRVVHTMRGVGYQMRGAE
ncbi:winged helix family two component transcriptional regulator [Promicromonospora sp. AC04]|uniref:response regulator transcription factor n=1 Tax=Promicromonospora sp. AC04 TaxID=2135723 RepID=UPI000D3D4D7C|nr:response regulator transcription factor [Promicromonospora sp. AC04]PUB19797.1 winged helix family two component transcriptional regulator [Promicromonospora sp. AC04]